MSSQFALTTACGVLILAATAASLRPGQQAEPTAAAPSGSSPSAGPEGQLPGRIDIKLADVRWQALPSEVTSVKVSPDHRTWYLLRTTEEGGPVDASVAKRVVEREFADPAPQLLDVRSLFFEAVSPVGPEASRLKRVWILCQNRGDLLGYDGARWIERRAPSGYHIDSAQHGSPFVQLDKSVVFFDPKGADVLVGDEWKYQSLYPPDAESASLKGFSIDDIWIWRDPDDRGLTVLVAASPPALWRYRDGSWTNTPLPARLKGFNRANAGYAAKLGAEIYLLQPYPRATARFRLQQDNRLEEIEDHGVITVGPYSIPSNAMIANDPVGTFYIASEEIADAGGNLGAGVVLCAPSGKARFFPDDPGPSPSAFRASSATLASEDKRVWQATGSFPGRVILLDSEELSVVGHFPNAAFTVVATASDGTVYAALPTGGSMVAYRENAPEARKMVYSETVDLDALGFCVASDGCIWACCGEKGLQRFDGRTWTTPPDVNLRIAVFALLPGKNGWVFLMYGHPEDDLKIEHGVLMTNLIGPGYFMSNARRSVTHTHLAKFAAEDTDVFLEAFGAALVNAPWIDRRPTVARLEGQRIQISALDIRGLRVAVDSNKNIWVLSYGILRVASPKGIVEPKSPWLQADDPSSSHPTRATDVVALGDGEYVLLRTDRGQTYFARLNGDQEVEFVEGPAIEEDDLTHQVWTLRDQAGGVWLEVDQGRQYASMPGNRNKRYRARRVTGIDAGQDFAENTMPVLLDASGCVWMAPHSGFKCDTFTIWAPSGDVTSLQIPGAIPSKPIFAGAKGNVFVWTSAGLCHYVAEDAQRPDHYALKQVYGLESRDGLALCFSRRLGTQYSSLGYVASMERYSGYGQTRNCLHLFNLENRSAAPATAAAASQPEAAATAPGARLRTWRDATGRYSVEAELLRAANGKVTLRKSDGSTVDVPIERLSEEDQSYVRRVAQ